jgi:hypothetical protein
MATAMSPFMHARNTILLVVNNIEGICHCHYMPKILAGFMGSTCGKQACPIYLMSSLGFVIWVVFWFCILEAELSPEIGTT